MTFSSIAALLGAMIVLAIVPGPGVFAVVARSIASGFAHGFVTTMGIVVGDFVFILIAIFGLSTIAEMMSSLFVFVKYLGGAYLIWLGIELFRSKTNSIEIEGIEESSWLSNFLSGLLITLGNPKAILFYLSFFPAFLDLARLSIVDTGIIMLVATFAIGGVMLVYAYLADKARTLFAGSSAKSKINKTAGSIMIGTGTLLIAKT
ncbi:LysE family translocator [Pseudomonadota bacterium]